MDTGSKSRAQIFREIAERMGARMAEPDDPIYSEGPSIMFLPPKSLRSKQKDLSSMPKTGKKPSGQQKSKGNI
jgi:hypothetical protein